MRQLSAIDAAAARPREGSAGRPEHEISYNPDPDSPIHSLVHFLSLLLCSLPSSLALLSMLARVSQLTRHLSRQLPAYTHRSAAALSGAMTSSTGDSLGKRMIHTAACLIIGDEVLGGKVRPRVCRG